MICLRSLSVLLTAGVLIAVPDPDLFDGRLMLQGGGSSRDVEGSQNQEDTGASSAGSEEYAVDHKSRDLKRIRTFSSKKTGGDRSERQSEETNASTRGGLDRSGSVRGEGDRLTGSAGSGVVDDSGSVISDGERSFDEFGFGSNGSKDTGVEVNTSKVGSAQADAGDSSQNTATVGSSRSSPSGGSEKKQSKGVVGPGGTPHSGRPSGDRGTSIPSGI